MAFTTGNAAFPKGSPDAGVKEFRRIKTEEVREYHQELIADLGISKLDFGIKIPFYAKGIQVVGIFPSEFRKENGVYFELYTREWTPLDPVNRTVYRSPINPHYEQEYEMNDIGQYIVAVEELRAINVQSVAISGPSAVTAGGYTTSKNKSSNIEVANGRMKVENKEDAPYSEMTIRDYIAIHTGRPISLKPWLNELIK